MSFDDPTRRALAGLVRDCRRLLAGDPLDPAANGDIGEQLQSRYGLQPDGADPLDVARLTHLDDRGREIAAELRAWLDHAAAGEAAGSEVDRRRVAFKRVVRETAFTVFNRLAALRMCEERRLIGASIRRGLGSDHFALFKAAAGSGFDDEGDAYRFFLEIIFDELAVDLPALFDRRARHSLVFPSHRCLLAVLERLNAPEFTRLWSEDETIGWIYQYFNPKEEREALRDTKRGGSAAPRNSRELAVRNQFFTPRYVVEFLTDNTLGRLWYEMTKGQTRLAHQCRYLVRRPCELFLPAPDATLWHDGVPGLEELRRFCSSANPADLPADPALGAVMGWVERLTLPAMALENAAGFLVSGAPPLTALLHATGASPENLEQRWSAILSRSPQDDPPPVPDPRDLHPVQLLHLLWRLGLLATGSGGPPSLPLPVAPVSAYPPAAALWQAFRERLQHPPADLPQAELLRQPVFIPHRPMKDPREIRLLDPACGSMHFGLYAFDLFETIYAEAWELGRVPPADFGADTPPFPHGSVRLDRRRETVHSNDLGTPVPAATARVVLLNDSDPGDGMFHVGPYLTDDQRRFRPGTAWEVPLAEFDYGAALAAGRFPPEAGERLVRGTPGAWEHDRMDPLPPEEVRANYDREVPRLIIEHNLHGIDIDPRAVQIAGLSLWLRAQRSWSAQGLRAAARPRIRRSGLVCAEPMPGEKELLREFVEREFPPRERELFHRLLAEIFDRMLLAGEAGSLLRIEEDIRAAVERERAMHQGGELDFEGTRFSSDAFWQRLEARLTPALQAYAEQAQDDGQGFQRQLFAEDAARGFAFIHLCQQRYDVAVMNPPFGDASLPSKPYIEQTYGDTKGDVYKAFVECFHDRLVPGGFLGIISSRMGFFLGQSEDWRTRVVLRLFRPLVLADLGSGVLDAMVEVAAYVLRSLSEAETRDLTLSLVPTLRTVELDRQERFSLPKWQAARDGLKRHQAQAELKQLEKSGFLQRSLGETVRYTTISESVKSVITPPPSAYPPLFCVRAVTEADKGQVLIDAVMNPADRRSFICDPGNFRVIAGCTFSYWVSTNVRSLFKKWPNFEKNGRIARQGGVNGDDFRYLRLWWEHPIEIATNQDNAWKPYAKGGEFSRYYQDISLAALWDSRRSTFTTFTGLPHRPVEKPASCEEYFRPGITWSRRSQRGLSLRALPANCIFSDKGPSGFIDSNSSTSLASLLAVTNSNVFRGLIALQMAFGSYEVGVFQKTPVPQVSSDDETSLSELAQRAWSEKRALDTFVSTSHTFVAPTLLVVSGETLTRRATAWAMRVHHSEDAVATVQAEIDDFAFRLYGLNEADRDALTTTLRAEPAAGGEGAAEDDGEGEDNDPAAPAVSADAPALAADLLAYALGAAFGRWDVRLATGQRPAPPVPDPFDPLPVCPPGMLQNAAGLPAGEADVPTDYPLPIAWPGILVDDETRPADDVAHRVREALELLWPERAHAVIEEACALLDVSSLREYFRRPGKFFAGHLKRYTKSRRQAPIYWPLASARGGYTLWLYYPRLSDQTLPTALERFVRPRLGEARDAVEAAEQRLAAPPPGSPPGALRDERDRLVAFRDELQAFHDELLRVANLPWRPDLNDGVLITASPLWTLFRHGPWRTDLQACWEALTAGRYDWAHLAFTLREPEVRAKCRTDRSLAIAHGLEADCETPAPAPARARRPRQPALPA